MNQQDDLSGLAEGILRPGEPSPPSNGASADPTRTEAPGPESAPNGIDKHDSFRDSVIKHNSDQAIMIDGYCVPSSLAAMVVPEPLASPPRSMADMLVDFGGAAVVAAVVALFATGKLTAPWNIGGSGKAEERPADARIQTVSAPSPLELSKPALSQSSAAATRPESESQWVRMVAAPASVLATIAASPAAVLSRSRPPVSAEADSDEADEGQQTAAAVSPTKQSEKAPPLLAQFVVARKLQGELKRVGCDPGNVDGDWNAASRRALESFNKHAGTKLDVRVASLDALGVIRSRRSRICPLACDRGSSVQGNRCVPVETPGGRRNAERNHIKRASAGQPTPSAATAPTASDPFDGATSEPEDTYWRRNANF
jgi:hypothetical protein